MNMQNSIDFKFTFHNSDSRTRKTSNKRKKKKGTSCIHIWENKITMEQQEGRHLFITLTAPRLIYARQRGRNKSSDNIIKTGPHRFSKIRKLPLKKY